MCNLINTHTHTHTHSRRKIDEMPKTMLRERARVAGDISHNRSRRKGTALLRALWTTFRTRTIVSAVICVGDSAVHISQVWVKKSGKNATTKKRRPVCPGWIASCVFAPSAISLLYIFNSKRRRNGFHLIIHDRKTSETLNARAYSFDSVVAGPERNPCILDGDHFLYFFTSLFPASDFGTLDRQALALGWLIAYFDDENSSSLSGWLAALSIVVIGFLYRSVPRHGTCRQEIVHAFLQPFTATHKTSQ